MFQKLKISLITAAVLVGGAASIAAAQGGDRGGDRQARKAHMLEKFDTNKDGKLDQTEKEAMQAQRAAKMFGKLDKNGDGVLSLDEFKSGKQFMGRGGHGGKFRKRP